MEKQFVAALNRLTGELVVKYFPLEGMTKEVQQTQPTADHFLFNDHDSCLRSACGYNEWPTGRGIFFNKNKTFFVWVNDRQEEIPKEFIPDWSHDISNKRHLGLTEIETIQEMRKGVEEIIGLERQLDRNN